MKRKPDTALNLKEFSLQGKRDWCSIVVVKRGLSSTIQICPEVRIEIYPGDQ